MSPPVNSIILCEASTVLILPVGIFLLDLLIPLGLAVWLLYLVPLTLMLHSPFERDRYYFSAAATILTAAGVQANGMSVHQGTDRRAEAMVQGKPSELLLARLSSLTARCTTCIDSEQTNSCQPLAFSYQHENAVGEW